MICSEVLKLKLMLKFIYNYCLNAMNSKQTLEIVSLVDYTYNGIFLISISMYVVIQVSRTQLPLGKI